MAQDHLDLKAAAEALPLSIQTRPTHYDEYDEDGIWWGANPGFCHLCGGPFSAQQIQKTKTGQQFYQERYGERLCLPCYLDPSRRRDLQDSAAVLRRSLWLP